MPSRDFLNRVARIASMDGGIPLDANGLPRRLDRFKNTALWLMLFGRFRVVVDWQDGPRLYGSVMGYDIDSKIVDIDITDTDPSGRGNVCKRLLGRIDEHPKTRSIELCLVPSVRVEWIERSEPDPLSDPRPGARCTQCGSAWRCSDQTGSFCVGCGDDLIEEIAAVEYEQEE